jgi:hypothetical protein
MMKLDVEGWESHVLAGAKQTLSRKDAPLLQVEFADAIAASAGSSCKQIYHMIEDFGYLLLTYDPRKKELIHDPLRESYPYLNLIATKRLDEINRRFRKGSLWRWLVTR